MLAYAHINLLEILRRFTSEEALRVATDRIYIRKSPLYKLEGAEAYDPEGSAERLSPECAPAQWHNK